MKKLAYLVSTVGNPVVIALFYGFCVFFTQKNNNNSSVILLACILGIMVPGVIYVYRKVKNKEFSNYDVSNKIQRREVYKYLIIAMSIMLICLQLSKIRLADQMIGISVFILLCVSYAINFKIKISMHTSFAFLFSYFFYQINPQIGIILFFSSFMIAASRLILNRHKLIEVVLGLIISNIIGLFFYYSQNSNNGIL